MSKQNQILALTFAASLTILAGCGGGGGADVAEGGMGGTGISQGPVTGFGSIYVNGVKYETDQAVFERDGSSQFAQSDFSLGEYVEVEGSINTDGLTGIANKVSYKTLLEGPIASIDTAAETITVLGLTVQLDPLTVRQGFSLLSDLQVGNMLEVSGINRTNTSIAATVVTKTSEQFIPGESDLEFKGIITAVDLDLQQVTVNGLDVDYSTSGFPGNTPTVGIEVEVKSTTTLNGNLVQASSIEIESPDTYTDDTELEIHGTVTAFTSTENFEVNGIPVTTNASTEFEDGLSNLLGLGVRVEVEGNIQNGILIVEEVSIRESESSIELEASITSIDNTTQTLVLFGQTVVVDSSTMLIDEDSDQNFSFANLSVGETIEVHGNLLSNGNIRATKIEREDEDDEGELELEGTVQSVDVSSFTLTLFLGVTVTTDGNTEFEAEDELNREAFFSQLEAGITKIKVKGSMTADTTLAAEKVELED